MSASVVVSVPDANAGGQSQDASAPSRPQHSGKTTFERPSQLATKAPRLLRRVGDSALKVPRPSATGSAVEEKKKKKKHVVRRSESMSRYIYKVLKQIHPDIGISRTGMGVMRSFVGDMFERLAAEAAFCAYAVAKTKTLKARDVHAATKSAK